MGLTLSRDSVKAKHELATLSQRASHVTPTLNSLLCDSKAISFTRETNSDSPSFLHRFFSPSLNLFFCYSSSSSSIEIMLEKSGKRTLW
ncbi:unnamed protein product [Arabidopsis lyrata]|nr:unnamed protein product [Arabidopsis lyrata]